MSAGRKSETTGAPTRAAITAASPVCQVAATVRPRKRLRLSLVIQRLPVAAHQFRFHAKFPLGGQHGIRVKFAQQKIQPSEIRHVRARSIHRRQDSFTNLFRVGILRVPQQFHVTLNLSANPQRQRTSGRA